MDKMTYPSPQFPQYCTLMFCFLSPIPLLSCHQWDEEECNCCKVEEALNSKKEASICNKWSATNEINLTKLTIQPTLAGALLRMHRQTMKKQVNNVITKMSWEEREDMTSKPGKMNQMEGEEHHFIFCNL